MNSYEKLCARIIDSLRKLGHTFNPLVVDDGCVKYGINMLPETLGVPRALFVSKALLDQCKNKDELEPYDPRKHNTKIIIMEEMEVNMGDIKLSTVEFDDGRKFDLDDPYQEYWSLTRPDFAHECASTEQEEGK